jgi:hypothetical protein
MTRIQLIGSEAPVQATFGPRATRTWEIDWQVGTGNHALSSAATRRVETRNAKSLNLETVNPLSPILRYLPEPYEKTELTSAILRREVA